MPDTNDKQANAQRQNYCSQSAPKQSPASGDSLKKHGDTLEEQFPTAATKSTRTDR